MNYGSFHPFLTPNEANPENIQMCRISLAYEPRMYYIVTLLRVSIAMDGTYHHDIRSSH